MKASYCGQRTYTGIGQRGSLPPQEPSLVRNDTTTSYNEHVFLLREKMKINNLGKQSQLTVQTSRHWLLRGAPGLQMLPHSWNPEMPRSEDALPTGLGFALHSPSLFD